jgi:WD repeat-containing protein 19
LKKSAFTYAVVLMRPENRNMIDPKYAKKIEGIVRKAPKGLKDLDDDSEIDYSPCPACGVDLATMETNCFQCKTTLPICIATGCHVVKDDMVACLECEFPAMKAAMIK